MIVFLSINASFDQIQIQQKLIHPRSLISIRQRKSPFMQSRRDPGFCLTVLYSIRVNRLLIRWNSCTIQNKLVTPKLLIIIIYPENLAPTCSIKLLQIHISFSSLKSLNMATGGCHKKCSVPLMDWGHVHFSVLVTFLPNRFDVGSGSVII